MAAKAENWSETSDRAERNAAHLDTMETTEPKKPKPVKGAAVGTAIVLPRPDIRELKIPIVGTTELITEPLSEKAKRQMREKQFGLPSAGREVKDPLACFLDSLYTIKPGKVRGNFEEKREDLHPDVWIEGGEYAMPAIAFKCAAVEACTQLGKGVITKVAARQCFHVIGTLVPIFGCNPRMREDWVNNNNGSPDVRYRAGFPEWRCSIHIRYNARAMTAEQIVNLFVYAGFGVGVGGYRPERGGYCGCFTVAEGAAGKKNGKAR